MIFYHSLEIFHILREIFHILCEYVQRQYRGKEREKAASTLRLPTIEHIIN